jgi:hypothetical protein
MSETLSERVVAAINHRNIVTPVQVSAIVMATRRLKAR